MKHKKTTPQFELPTAGEVFNLVAETTQDGWKEATRKTQLEHDREQSAKRQLEMFCEPAY